MCFQLQKRLYNCKCLSVSPLVSHKNPSASQNCSYWASCSMTIVPIDHQAYWQLSQLTIELIDHWAYLPLLPNTIHPTYQKPRLWVVLAISGCSRLALSQCMDWVQSIAVKQTVEKELSRIFVCFCGRQMQICYMSSTGAHGPDVRPLLLLSLSPLGHKYSMIFLCSF